MVNVHLLLQHERQRFVVHRRDAVNDFHVTRRLAAAIGFVGEVMSSDTPDPIPNSEVKPRQPMILLSGKVGHCRLFQPRNRKVAGLSFWNFITYGEFVMTHYCSLGNKPFLVSLTNEEEDITFEFVKLGNMKDVNEQHIHTHGLEFHNENEMNAH